MNKMVIMLIVVLLVFPVFAVAENSTDCGFFCKVSEFLWGDAENRAGKGWFDRGNIVFG